MDTLFNTKPLGEIQIEKITFSGITSFDAAVRSGTKIFRWGRQQAGHCTLDAGMLELVSGGLFTFSGNLSSSRNDDSWGILHFDFKQANGLVLWSSGAFWSPTIGRWAPWIINSTYPAHLFDTIAIVQFWSHC